MAGQHSEGSFHIRARHDDLHHGRVMTAPSVEAAAIAYVEHLPVLAGDHSWISVVVRDLQTGHEHSFRVELDAGHAARRE